MDEVGVTIEILELSFGFRRLKKICTQQDDLDDDHRVLR
jgi:hypothetical protein